MKIHLVPAGAVLALVVAAACGGGDVTDPVAPEPVASVTVSPTDLEIEVGATGQLSVSLHSASGRPLSGRTVTWSSEDDGVASVAGTGRVTAMAEGTVKITAAAEGRSGSADVRVIPPPTSGGPVASVRLEPSSADVEEGVNVVLVATPLDATGQEVPGRVVQWSSADPAVALIAGDGVVTTLRPGTAEIVARVDGVTARAEIRVTADHPYDLVFDGWSGVPGVAPELLLLDLRDARPAPVRVLPAGSEARDPTPSPDGTRVAYVVRSGMDTDIYVADRDGSNVTRLTYGGAEHDQPAWSPDGTRIAYRRWPTGEDADIWVMDAADGSNAVDLTGPSDVSGQSSPAWSPALPGGYRIVFSHSEAGYGHLYSMADDGSDWRKLTSRTDAYDDEPAWSPAGDQIAFVRAGPGFTSDLWSVTPEGNREWLLRSLSGPQFAPAWSPDGRLLAFASHHEGYAAGDDTFDLYTVRADGSRLARRTVDDDVDAQRPAWMMRP